MTPSEYQELTGYFIEQVGRIRDETRTAVEVSVESLRHEIRLVADGVLQNGRRIDENGRRIEENGRRIEALTGRVDALAGRMDDLERSVSGR